MMDSSPFDPFETKIQSYSGPGISPQFQEGVTRIDSWHMPTVVDGFDGAQNMARAE